MPVAVAAGASPYTLRPLEWIVLRTVRCLCQRAVVGLVLLALAAGAAAILVRWVASLDAARAGETTLYNPERLRETLCRFALPGTGGSVAASRSSATAPRRSAAPCLRPCWDFRCQRRGPNGS